MRIIQVAEDEKMNEQYSQDVIRQLRNTFNYATHEQPSANKEFPIVNSDSQLNFELTTSNKKTKCIIENEHYFNELCDETLTDNEYTSKTQNELTADMLKNAEEWNEFSVKGKQCEI